MNHFPKPENLNLSVTFAFAVSSSNLSSLSVRTTVVVKTKGEVWVHQNTRFFGDFLKQYICSYTCPLFLFSHLGQWEAVVVEGVPLLMNLTLHSSCGLIFGRLDTTRWLAFNICHNKQVFARFSVNLPSCVPLATVSLSLLASPSTSIICLQVVTFSVAFSLVFQNSESFPYHSTPTQDEIGREQCKKPRLTTHSTKTRDFTERASLWVRPFCEFGIMCKEHADNSLAQQVSSIPIVWRSGQGGLESKG